MDQTFSYINHILRMAHVPYTCKLLPVPTHSFLKDQLGEPP